MHRLTLHVIAVHFRLTGLDRRRVVRMPRRIRPVKYLRNLLEGLSLRLGEEEECHRKENPRGSLYSVERTVKTDLHDLAELLRQIVFSSIVGRNTSVGDHDIEIPKVDGDLLNAGLNLGR